jgi:hypothetical protein
VEEESGSGGARPEVGGDPDRWGPPIGGRKRGRDTLLGWDEVGPGPNLGLGRFGSPSASFIFFVSFSVFSFLFYLLQS